MSAVPVRDLFIVRDAARQAHESRVADALSDWAKAWIPGDAGWSPRVVAACATEGALPSDGIEGWAAHGKPGATVAHAWSGAREGAARRLAALMTGCDSAAPLTDDDWAAQAAAAALRDLHARLMGPAMTSNAGAASPDLRLLAGTVIVREDILGLAWAFAPDALMVDAARSAGSSATATPVTQGIASQQVRVSVGLGEVQIDVADLLGLQVGDVIRFPSTLKGPVAVDLGEPGQAKPAMDARLGQLNGHVAVQLQSKRAAA